MGGHDVVTLHFGRSALALLGSAPIAALAAFLMIGSPHGFSCARHIVHSGRGRAPSS